MGRTRLFEILILTQLVISVLTGANSYGARIDADECTALLFLNRDASPFIKWVRSGYDGLGAWRGDISWSEESQLIELWMENLSLLKGIERELALEALLKSPPKNRALVFNLKLALGYEAAWQDLLLQVIKNRKTSLASNFENGIGRIASRLPKELKDSLLLKMGEAYPRLMKTEDGMTSAKRQIDYLIHAMIDPEIMHKEISNGKSALSAYQKYLSTMRAKLRIVDGRYFQYDAKDIFAVAEVVQSKIGMLAGSGNKNPLVVLGGSFTAGRAKIKGSDIDFMTNFYPGSTDALEKKVQHYFKTRGVESSLDFGHYGEFEADDLAIFSEPGELASSNPVLILVSKKKIELLFYGRQFKLRFDDSASALPERYILSPP